MLENEWENILKTGKELISFYPDSIILICGVAVYYHSIMNKIESSMIEQSHDSDFYISMMDYIDLKDIEDITSNSRLSKHQLIKKNVEFDIYVESTHNLLVSYEDLVKHSVVNDDVRFASLSHLLPLKLAAYVDRKNSAKGKKDLRDIIKIVFMINENNIVSSQIGKYMSEDFIQIINDLKSNQPVFYDLNSHNHHKAKGFKKVFDEHVDLIYNIFSNINKIENKKWTPK